MFAICDIAQAFVEESHWPVTFSYGSSLRTFKAYIETPNAEILVVDMDGKIMGGALLFSDTDFHFEPFGYIGKFYISKEARSTSAAIRLIKACNEWFDERNCAINFVTATAGLTERSTKAFVRIMERHGYRIDDPILIRGDI